MQHIETGECSIEIITAQDPVIALNKLIECMGDLLEIEPTIKDGENLISSRFIVRLERTIG